MGFFTKSREKGLKSVTKEKQKKANAAVTAAVLITSAALKTTPTTTEVKKPTSPTFVNATNLVVQDVKIDDHKPTHKRQKSDTTSFVPVPAAQPSAASSLPWWVGDLSFMVEGKKITAHKVVVTSKSKQLAQLVEQNPSGVIEIIGFTHDIFSQLIKWIYGGRFDIPVQDAENLHACALAFDVQDLVEACSNVKKSEVDFQPVVMAPIMTELANQELQHQQQLQQQQFQYQQQQQQQQQTYYPEYNHDFNLDAPNFVDDLLTSPTFEGQNEFQIPSHSPDQGMSIWSDDPILYNPEPHEVDAYRLMEIF